jgi:hypothetical protein
VRILALMWKMPWSWPNAPRSERLERPNPGRSRWSCRFPKPAARSC